MLFNSGLVKLPSSIRVSLQKSKFEVILLDNDVCLHLLQYVEAVVSSYMRALRLESGSQFKSWESKGFRIVKECIQKLAESLACEVVQPGTQKVTRTDAERWLQQNPTFLKMLAHVFSHLYHYRATTKNPQEDTLSVRRKSIAIEYNQLLPFCEGM